MNNSFNQFGLTAANCLSSYQANAAAAAAAAAGNSSGQVVGYHHSQVAPSPQQQSSTTAAPSMDMRMAIQQFATGQFVSFGQSASAPNNNSTGSANNSSSNNSASAAGTVHLKNVSCLQKEIETLKKQNGELHAELEKLRAAYTECNYQLMASNVKITNYYEQLQQIQKERLDEEKAFKELKMKYEDKFSGFQQQQQSPSTDERSLFCDECNFEVKSQVALFIHKLNHYFEQSIPRHLQLSTRSFSTMPDDSIQFKYKCHCCEIDPQRQFARHEIYMHIYQFHTFDMPFKCKFCFLYFTSKSYLNDHLMEKHSLPNRNNKTGRTKRMTGGQSSSSPVASFSATTSDIKQEQSDQLNSTLSLSARTHPVPTMKRIKTDYHHHQSSHGTHHQSQHHSQTSELNDLFQQLVGETTMVDPNNSAMNTQSSSSVGTGAAGGSSSGQVPPIKTFETMKRDAEIQQIMNDLDGDVSLNCKYPGCKFVATTKNHLKFHISAHLMSKYKCPYCTFVGNRVVEIKRHILKSSKHADQHVFLCPGCDFASDCEKTFRDHYGRYHNSSADVTTVIEQMFLNESNKVGQNMISAMNSSNNNSNSQNNCDLQNKT